VSSAWKSKIGTGTSVNWPDGVGGKGSAGVSAVVAQTQGAIGYADVAFALQNHFSYFAMKNRSGKFATPGARGILAAASSDQTPDPSTNALSIVNPPKKFPLAYPISTYTYVIVPLKTSKAADIRRFLFWAVTKGQTGTYTAKLRFVPIPKKVLVVAEKAIKKISS
jgi:phosphate transport system substrate-binding protein